MYLTKLKEIKEQKRLTNAEIAKLSNVPLPTITRIFNGQTPNPTFETFSSIAIALGSSLDEIAGLKSAEDTTIAAPIVSTLDSYSELLKEKDERINELKEEVKAAKKVKLRFFIALACVVGFVLLFLAVDILNGNFGYFRY
jgi:transcriptional regulator with XRE-family HTH domain